jgi:hypothetical protein
MKCCTANLAATSPALRAHHEAYLLLKLNHTRFQCNVEVACDNKCASDVRSTILNLLCWRYSAENQILRADPGRTQQREGGGAEPLALCAHCSSTLPGPGGAVRASVL